MTLSIDTLGLDLDDLPVVGHCRICGIESGLKYRWRSSMVLCQPCHEETPEKVGYEEFLAAIGQRDEAVLKSFYEDYRTSRFSSPKAYWRSCSR